MQKEKKAKLLIITQKIDINDPILGFFVRWVEEFSKHCEQVTVICLEEGKHNFSAKNAVPRSENSEEFSGTGVRVFSLGKEKKRNSLQKLFSFFVLLFTLRKEYDAVFVHMNSIYVILGGLFWRILGKKIGLWYTHKHVDLKLRIASVLAHDIFTASKESFRLKSKKVHAMGHGIDTDFFAPDASFARGGRMLSVGRLMSSKRHDLAIRAVAFAGRELRIAGDGPERENLESLARTLGATVHFLGGLTQAQLRDEYRSASVLVHTSETGSLDKVVLEAMACGLPVVTTSDALPDLPVIRVAQTPEAVAKAVIAMHKVDPLQLADYVCKNHSITTLIPRIIELCRYRAM